jgi:hypothetical protein
MPYDPLACAVICIVLYAISVVSVVLRFYVRFYLLNNTSTDDYLAAGAAVRPHFTISSRAREWGGGADNPS